MTRLVTQTAFTNKAVVDVSADAEQLAHSIADWFASKLRERDGRIAVALSGGSTPRRFYELLADNPWRDAIPWERVYWFWGDERFVPRTDPDSNDRMALEALLSRAPVPPANIHPIPTEGLSAEEAAAAYERILKRFYGAETLEPKCPLFDVTFLGLGEDGHIASLFPQSPVLEERARWVRAVHDAQYGTRITLTYPALESSRDVALIVSSEKKRDIFARFVRGETDFPAARLNPLGALHVFADRATAPDAVDIG